MLHPAALVALASAALAAPTAADPGDPADLISQLRQQIGARDQTLDPLLGRGPLAGFHDRVDSWREWSRQHLGLDYGLSYSVMFQQGSQGGQDDDTLNGVLDLVAEWMLFDGEDWGRGGIGIWFNDTRQFRSSPEQFSDAVGSSYLLNDSDPDQTALKFLFWGQATPDDRLRFMLGQIELNSLFGLNAYAGDDRSSFFAGPLSRDAQNVMPLSGLGAALQLWPFETGYVSGGFVDGNANGRYPDFGSFGRGEYFAIGEVGWTPTLAGLGRGNYRLSGWHASRTRTKPSGWGLILSLDQELGEEFGVFLRYGFVEDLEDRIDPNLGAGVVFTRPFGRRSDWIGLGFIWSRPTDGRLRDDYGLEAFWRVLVLERLELTPDLQLVIAPARTPARDVVFVGGVRLRLIF